MSIELSHLVEQAISENASDLYLAVGQKVFLRVDGKMHTIGEACLSKEQQKLFLDAMLGEAEGEKLQKQRALDFSWTCSGRRFRGNAYFVKGSPSVVLRLVPDRIPSLSEIGAPQALFDLLSARHGLVLVTGTTGAGKSTTLAAFLEELNGTRPMHIITLEDPVEYLYVPKAAFISQRELGSDFYSFPKALRSALREMPDVILVGELRDAETVRTALMAAESGILVLGTLHSKNATEASMRVEGMFPAGERDSVRSQLAACVTAVISQRLVEKRTGGRTAAMEILLANDAVRNLLRQGKYTQLQTSMMSGKGIGMQTMEMAMQELRRNGVIV